MYYIYIKPLNEDHLDIFIGCIGYFDFEKSVSDIINYIHSPSNDDPIYNRSIVELHNSSRYFRFSIRDAYNNSKECCYYIYDNDENKIIEEKIMND